jgi:hypothetical protein
MSYREIVGVARVRGVLEDAGAYDVTPISIPCNQYSKIAFMIEYQGEMIQALGSLLYKIEWSNNNTNWYQVSETQAPAITAGMDLTLATQRAESEYTATTANIERFMTPNFEIGGQFVRIVFAEGTNKSNPGTVYAEYYMCGEVE